MQQFNDWLNTIQHNGQGIELYNLTGTVCMTLLAVSILLYVWRQRLNPFKAIPIGMIVYYFLGYAQHIMTWYRRDFAFGEGFFGTSNIGYAFTLLPLVCWLCDITFNLPKGTSGELAAVSTLAWHWLGRSGCTFSGCCRGIDCEWGIYSVYAGGNTFPVCWLESLLALGILIFLLVRMLRRGVLPEDTRPRKPLVQWYYRRRRQPDNGRALPYMLLLYGGGRFFTEFLRYHPEEDILFGFLPEFSVHALLMVLVGALTLYLNLRRTKAAEVGEEPLTELKAQHR